MEKLKDFANKITGKDNRYTHNLLGESLADLLRRATAKTLQGPDDIANEQVCTDVGADVPYTSLNLSSFNPTKFSF